MTERLKQFERVGCGGMAEVFRGAIQGERGTGRSVAIKRLRPDLHDDPAAVELFVREAQVSLSLNHPNVVHALELTRDEAGYALVCEWLEGASLDDLRRRLGLLPPACVVYVGQALTQALTYVHKSALGGAGLVHRDVTPANVFVTTDGQVKLGDFGVALCDDRPSFVTVKAAGTLEFAAPEQLSGGPVDVRTDVFGLGKTLRAIALELPAPLGAVLSRACAPEPDARFASAEEFGVAWTQAASSVPEPTSADAMSTWITTAGGLPAAPTAPRLDDHVSSLLKNALDPGLTATPAVATPPTRRVPVFAALGGAVVVASVGLWAALQWPDEQASKLTPSSPAASPLPPPVELPSPLPVEVHNTPTEPSAIRRPLPVRKSGLVSLNAIPWASVDLDGRGLGNTPLKGLELIEGKHLLILVNPAQGLRREIVVEVTPGTRQTFLVDLRRGTVNKRTDPN